jgi:uridine kinase
MSRHFLIGIAGGTGSGKTSVAKALLNTLGSDRVKLIQFDSYYKDLSNLSFEERSSQNFDHPEAIDEYLLVQHIQTLLDGKTINRPIYDFSTHLRTKETATIDSHDVILLEGILALHFESLRNLMDIKIFIDTDVDIRLIRRLKRDLTERGRTLESILEQYEKSVRPMHIRFVEPTKQFADAIIPQGGQNSVAIDLLKTKIKAILKEI